MPARSRTRLAMVQRSMIKDQSGIPTTSLDWHIPEDVRFGGGGCRGGLRPQGENSLDACERGCATMHMDMD
mgnify:CR=1 FL=1